MCVCITLLGVMMLVCAYVSTASAATCTKQQRNALVAATRDVAVMRSAGNPLAADAASLVKRAAHRCQAAFATRAIVLAERRMSSPAVGRRRGLGGFRLVAEVSPRGTVWRVDLVTMVRSTVSLHPGVRQRRQLSKLDAIAFSNGTRIVWSSDPTRRQPVAATQSTIALLLSRRGQHVRARATVRAFRSPQLRSAVAHAPLLLAAMQSVNLAAVGAREGDAEVARIVSLTVRPVMRRMAAADTGSWSRIDGVPATLAQHTALLARVRAMSRYAPGPAMVKTATSLARELVTPPDVQLMRVPTAAFYPWPHDGVLDASTVTLGVDKPATIEVRVFAAGSAVQVRSFMSAPVIGAYSALWDGTDVQGALLPTGSYPYAIIARDLAGNIASLPGLGAFVIARDATPPRIDLAGARLVASSGVRRTIRVRWRVTEPISPQLTTRLVLTRMVNGVATATRRTYAVPSARTTGTVRIGARLTSGRWRASLVVRDGSGNKASSYAGTLQLP